MTVKTEDLTISVVIPAYNVQDYVARAMDSVLRQTRPAYQIIVVDDGSSDQTAAIVQKYSSKVIYYHQANGGLSSARNRGIQLAGGDWIAFLDADDAWLPDKLQRQCQLLKVHPDLQWLATGFSYRCNQQIPSFKPGMENQIGSYFELDMAAVLVLPSSVMIKRDLLLEVGRFREGRYFGEDVDLWLRLALAGHAIGYCAAPLVDYEYQRPGSLNDQIRDTRRMDDILTILDRYLTAASRGDYEAHMERYAARFIMRYIEYYAGKGRCFKAVGLLKKYGYLLAGRQKTEYQMRAWLPGMNGFFTWYHNRKRQLRGGQQL